MWRWAFDRFLNALMVADQLTVRFPDGSTRKYGPNTGQHATIHITDDATVGALCVNPLLALGEAYVDQRLSLPDSDLEGILKLLCRNRLASEWPNWLRAVKRVQYHKRLLLQRNAPYRAKANVALHYDISDEFYAMFLDKDMQYSCGYFVELDTALDVAQCAKKTHIARKLLLEPGMSVLDIGCGWGGMALTLARDYGARVTGITLSKNQLATARQRAKDEGLSDQVTFRLQDYRHTKGVFDRVVSVGMLEHVGVPNYDAYFECLSNLLAPNGIALIHTIGRSGPPTSHDPWLHKYIFPGGYVPSLSELLPSMERAGLWQTDIEVWRLHYALTLRHWRERFLAHEEEILRMYDARFVRMFYYYLTVCIIAFEDQMHGVYQIQLAHQQDAVPLTRDYLYARSVV